MVGAAEPHSFMRAGVDRSASWTTRSRPAGRVEKSNALFAAKPTLEKNNAVSLPKNVAASGFQSASCSGSLPRSKRDPPEPIATPRSSAATIRAGAAQFGGVGQPEIVVRREVMPAPL